MSVNNRKIGLYSFELINENKEKLKNDELVNYFDELIQYIQQKEYDDKLFEVPISNKFFFLDNYTSNERIRNCIIKSAKIGHRPPLIKKETGEERENPKLIDEGESERTHLITKYKDDEIIVAIEERKVGATIGQIVNYLNNFIIQMPHEDYFSISLNIIPFSGFLEHLRDFKRITVGIVEIDKKYFGTEYLEFADLGDTTRENIDVIFKANRRDSILPEIIINIYNKFKEQKIKRVRIQGVTHEKTGIQLDTDKLKKVEHIDVSLNDATGLVNKNDIFEKLNVIIKDL